MYNAAAYPEVNNMNAVLDQNETQYKYDKAGRLVHSYVDINFTDKISKSTIYQTDYNYDLNGNMSTISRFDGLNNQNVITNMLGADPILNTPNNCNHSETMGPERARN